MYWCWEHLALHTTRNARRVKVEFWYNVKQFSWCSGYHICLTHRRSPVRSRATTSNFFSSYFHSTFLLNFKNTPPLFLYSFVFNLFIFVYIWFILQRPKVSIREKITIFCFFFFCRIPWEEWKCIVHVLIANGCIFRIKLKIIALVDMASKQVTLGIKPFWVTFIYILACIFLTFNIQNLVLAQCMSLQCF